MRIRKNDGFTLVELMVTILVASIVTVAATSLLLMGLKIYNQSNRTQKMQNNIRILTAALEDMTSECKVQKVETNFDSWYIKDENGNTICQYKNGTIYLGESMDTPVLSDIHVSNAMRTDENLLTIAVETEQGTFSTTIYCRTGIEQEGVIQDGATNLLEDGKNQLEDTANEARKAFLDKLAGEYGSTGMILGSYECYSQWYITTKGGTWGEDGWNRRTPWCACYISWALAKMDQKYVTVPNNRKNVSGEPYWYANVDDFLAYFQGDAAEHDWTPMRNNASAPSPEPGDVIFFDWTDDILDDPEHVGVVLYVDKGAEENSMDDIIYTIEGNSLGMVAIRQYAKTDTAILGYGILPWVTDAELNGENTGE